MSQLAFKGLEPKTQEDIVNQRYPKEDTKLVEFDSERLPGLKTGFTTEEQLAGFILNTLRMRQGMQEWEFSQIGFGECRWQRILSSKDLLRFSLEQKAARLAEVMFSNSNCVALRLSVDGGMEAGVSDKKVTERNLRLRIRHKN